jgi:NADH-quinone oxidoreductase subunit A
MVLAQKLLLAEGGPDLLQILAIFAAAAFLFGFGALLVGRLLRPHRPNPDKATAYECGELPVGPGWVQFDLRFYVVALVFLVFDVELALFYPWAVLFGGGGAPAEAGGAAQGAAAQALHAARWAAMWDMLFFFGVIVVGFVFLWRFGYLDWVRATRVRVEARAPVAEEEVELDYTRVRKAVVIEEPAQART